MLGKGQLKITGQNYKRFEFYFVSANWQVVTMRRQLVIFFFSTISDIRNPGLFLTLVQ